MDLCVTCCDITYYYYLVGVVEEVNRDAEWQRVVIWIPQQYRKDLHTGWPGLPLTLLLCPLHRALAVDGIFTHFSPENNRETLVQWYIIGMYIMYSYIHN